MSDNSCKMLVLAITLLGTWKLSTGEQLSKPYTLVVPMMGPLGGTVSPMGAFFRESAEFALAAINSQRQVLPNYNLAIDVGDDQCIEGPAVKTTMNLFLNYQPTIDLITSPSAFGEFHPVNSTFSNKTAITGYVIPLYLGGICSAACSATARLPQHFDFIDVVNACNDPALGDRVKYPNFYRFLPSLIQVSGIRTQFLQLMGWTKVAIISDALTVSYSDVFNLMKALQKGNIEIIATEFFIDNPTEAVSRIKASGSRIIFATCYVSVCPALACTAYQQDLYGPKYIWIFRTTIDLLSPLLNRPPGCDKSMTDAFAERALFIGADHEGNSLDLETSMTQTGVTLKQFNENLAVKTKGLQRNGAYGWRYLPFEAVHTAAHIAHNLEVELNKNNETLKDIITNPSRRKELREIIRRKTLTVDVRGLYGRTAFQPNTTDPYVPVIIVDQVQDGVRKTVWLNDNPQSPKLAERFRIRIPPKWDTKDGNPPKSHPTVLTNTPTVAAELVIANWGLGGLVISIEVGLAIYRIKFNTDAVHTSSASPDLSSITTTVGFAVVQAVVFTYPSKATLTSMNYFCKSGTVLILIGLCISASSVAMKLWAARYAYQISHQRRAHPQTSVMSSAVRQPKCRSSSAASKTSSDQGPRAQRIALLITVCYAVLIIIWYATSNSPTSQEQTIVKEDNEADTILFETWLSCGLLGNADKSLGALIALQGAILLTGIIGALKNRGIKFLRAAGIKEAGFSMYVLTTLCAIAILAIKVLQGVAVVYGVMTAFSYCCSILYIFLLNRQTTLHLLIRLNITKPDLAEEAIPVAILSQHQKPKTRASILPSYQTNN